MLTISSALPPLSSRAPGGDSSSFSRTRWAVPATSGTGGARRGTAAGAEGETSYSGAPRATLLLAAAWPYYRMVHHLMVRYI